jgi:hypothetical protein
MRILFFIFFIILNSSLLAQFGLTKSQVVNKNGTCYKYGKSKDDIEFVSYTKNEESEDYIRTTYYFSKTNGLCDLVAIVQYKEKANFWIQYFDYSYKRDRYMIWRDYTTRISCSVQIEGNYVIIYEYWQPK